MGPEPVICNVCNCTAVRQIMTNFSGSGMQSYSITRKAHSRAPVPRTIPRSVIPAPSGYMKGPPGSTQPGHFILIPFTSISFFALGLILTGACKISARSLVDM
ncbi:hypothetical protein E2C01_087063 [Portunus trituberculatus]|uniref:Uncharacterized protein n=1 Tax=Portunus trituberculatus TaxID=210409 RepID=A0A5B7JI23_PORTR|nr:hypothetical protein [Portunus trituberculatus]